MIILRNISWTLLTAFLVWLYVEIIVAIYKMLETVGPVGKTGFGL